MATVIKPQTSVFLAGSIEMGIAENWQDRIIETFKDWDNLILYNPRRDDWNSNWSQTGKNPHLDHQIDWELNKLEQSTIVFMYLSPGTKSPISLLELGLYANSNKLIVCCPDGFWRKRNVEMVCNRYDVPLSHTFDEGVKLLTKTISHS